MVNSREFDPLSPGFDPLSSGIPEISSGKEKDEFQNDHLLEVNFSKLRDEAVLTPAPVHDPKKLEKLKAKGKLFIYNPKDNRFRGTEKKVQKLQKFAEKGRVSIEDSSGKRRRIDLSKATFTVLSDSEYHAQISTLAREIIKKNGLDLKEKAGKVKKGKDNWIQQAVKRNRVKDITIKEDSNKRYRIFQRGIAKALNQQSVINRNRRDERNTRRWEREKAEFRREMTEDQIEIQEKRAEVRKEDVKEQLGLPPNLKSLEDLIRERRKKGL